MSLRKIVLLTGPLLLACPALRAQDTLHIFAVRGGWNIHHKVKKGETLFQLARYFKAPPALLAEVNGLTYNDQLREGAVVNVPLGAFNLSGTPPKTKALGRALVYITKEGDDLSSISRQASVSKTNLQTWNRMHNGSVGLGQRLFVGWVAVDTTAATAKPAAAMPTNKPAPVAAPKGTGNEAGKAPYLYETPAVPDTVAAVNDSLQVSPGEAEFSRQTSNGSNVVTERGAVVLFTSSLRPSNDIYSGFFNGAQRGAIIEVRNLNNGKTIFVKVLGPLPATKLYYNAAMGISSAARRDLGVTDERTLCQFRFAGY